MCFRLKSGSRFHIEVLTAQPGFTLLLISILGLLDDTHIHSTPCDLQKMKKIKTYQKNLNLGVQSVQRVFKVQILCKYCRGEQSSINRLKLAAMLEQPAHKLVLVIETHPYSASPYMLMLLTIKKSLTHQLPPRHLDNVNHY